MKTFTKSLLIAILFISAVWIKQANADAVTGHVRYSDNNELVTSGYVKVYDLLGILIAQQPINNQGEYYVSNLQPPIQVDIIGFPGMGNEEDFPPTFFPSTTDPLNAVSTLISGTVTNRDIYVERIIHPPVIIAGNISGNITLNNRNLADAVVYVSQNGHTMGYGISANDGSFEINGLPLGDYILAVHKLGCISNIANVTVAESGLNVSYNLEKTKDVISSVTPSKFSLSQNYPNPFNPSTKINYTLAKDSKVTLAVYNTNGQLVQTIINELQSSGTYDVQFDAKNLATGVYYYKLETESFTQTRKMILVK